MGRIKVLYRFMCRECGFVGEYEYRMSRCEKCNGINDLIGVKLLMEI